LWQQQQTRSGTDAILPSAERDAERDDLKRGDYRERMCGQAAASASPVYGVQFEDQGSRINLKKA
jgi:hypothetical protein